MPNPYASRSRRSTSEVQSPLDHLAARLRGLGAGDDDLDAFRKAWTEAASELEDGDRKEFDARVAELLHLDDGTLRRMVAAARGDDPDVDDEPSLEQDENAVVMGLVDGERSDHPDWPTEPERGTVEQVWAWVNDAENEHERVYRARLALVDEKRSSLIERLTRVLSDDAD